ncbi:MAG: protoporphyrinogen oxidase HemJ [Gammaproteobacteria bacterium]|nr:MAG: protoporphyrinogen oxidase HemJ [Gammaproteobacteria bacterium]
MLWVKAFHVIFMVTWFAGLFYLPRLFVYHAATEDEAGSERFKVMERKLFIIMTIGGVGTLVFGLWLLFTYAWSVYGSTVWLPLKLAGTAALVAYHLYCGKLVADFRHDRNRHSHVFYRWINELPAILLILIVILVMVKPF